MPAALAGTALPFAWGDLAALRDLLLAHGGEVAAIMMEPMRSELPPPGYLEGVKELARAHGALLIFGEVSCGFRPHIGGAQAYLGVTPDMTVLAKAMSNGYPMGAESARARPWNRRAACSFPGLIGATTWAWPPA